MNTKRQVNNERSRRRAVRAFWAALALLAMTVCVAGCAPAHSSAYYIVIAPAKGGQPAHVTLGVPVFQGNMVTPMPYWIREPNQVGDRVSYFVPGPDFVLEFIPKGQDFDHWTRLFGVYGFHMPQVSPELFLEDTRRVFMMSCKRGGTLTPLVENERRTTPVEKNEQFATFEYDCPEMNQRVLPTGGNTVEHGYLFIAHVKDSYVRLFLSWRGAGDNATQAPDWATNPEIRERILFNLRKTHYVSSEFFNN